ncbi:hypothetical protein EVAR_276_1 [Eumeta japonica]|uniref:Uncharacterized protein n=1 Tax=Eumeta variegata TaxID=151549 RepID=A0A4C1S9G6_EUMVA|nr:hypothetical protein EVAR_276_1 [Eumeta japonica]
MEHRRTLDTAPRLAHAPYFRGVRKPSALDVTILATTAVADPDPLWASAGGLSRRNRRRSCPAARVSRTARQAAPLRMQSSRRGGACSKKRPGKKRPARRMLLARRPPPARRAASDPSFYLR